MSKKANPTIVGLFVIVGLVLLVAGAVSFSSLKGSGPVEKYVLYFDSSVMGLNPGAPVTHRGVKIGTVSDIQLRFNQAASDFSVPVFIELQQSLIEKRSDRKIDVDDNTLYADLIKQGLRGKLEAASFVTGQLYVDLSMEPEAPEPVYHQIIDEYKEIPTVASGIESVMASLAQVDIVGITRRLSDVLEKLETKIEEVDMRGISTSLEDVLVSINRVMNNPSLGDALRNISLTLEDFKETSVAIRGDAGKVSERLDLTLAEVGAAVDELKDGVADIRHTFAADSVLARDLSDALEKIAIASNSIAELAEFLRLHPNALISGRKNTESEK